MGYNIKDIFYLNLPIIGHAPLRHMEMLQVLEIVSDHEYKVKNLNEEEYVIDTIEHSGLFYDININQNFLLRLGFKKDVNRDLFQMIVKNADQDVLVTIEKENDCYRLKNIDANGILRGHGIIANYPMFLQTFKTLFGFDFPYDIKTVANACGKISAKYATYQFDLSKAIFGLHSSDSDRRIEAQSEFVKLSEAILTTTKNHPEDEFLKEMLKVIMSEMEKCLIQ